MSDAEHKEQENEEDMIEAKALGFQLFTTKEMTWPVEKTYVKDFGLVSTHSPLSGIWNHSLTSSMVVSSPSDPTLA